MSGIETYGLVMLGLEEALDAMEDRVLSSSIIYDIVTQAVTCRIVSSVKEYDSVCGMLDSSRELLVDRFTSPIWMDSPQAVVDAIVFSAVLPTCRTRFPFFSDSIDAFASCHGYRGGTWTLLIDARSNWNGLSSAVRPVDDGALFRLLLMMLPQLSGTPEAEAFLAGVPASDIAA